MGDVDRRKFTGGPKLSPSRYIDPPVKVRGRHRWIATALYWLTRDEAAALSNPRPERPVHLDLENLGYVGVGCVDCEQTWPSPEPCPAGDEWTPLH